MKKIHCAILFVLLSTTVYAQEDFGQTVDETFAIARQKIFNGEMEEGRLLLSRILSTNPDYYDVRILLARSYAWNKQRELAQVELRKVLVRKPDHEDALNAMIDVSMWNDQYDQALHWTNSALAYYPGSEGLLYKKGSILDDLGRPEEAINVLDSLLKVNSGHEKARALKGSIEARLMKYTAGVSTGVDIFSRTFEPAYYASLQVARSNSWGSSIVRVNYASRFASRGVQGEVDLYPSITRGMYAYVNYGYSSSNLFAKHRVGGELYTKLPHSIEASAGVRYLFFGSGSDVLIYTGSVGWYFGNCWISYRPYITPDNAGTSYSSSLQFRKYFADADTYVGFNGGFGFSPDERRIQTAVGLGDDGIYVLKSQNLGLSWQQKFKHQWILSISYSLVRQELTFDEGKFVLISSASVGIRKRF